MAIGVGIEGGKRGAVVEKGSEGEERIGTGGTGTSTREGAPRYEMNAGVGGWGGTGAEEAGMRIGTGATAGEGGGGSWDLPRQARRAATSERRTAISSRSIRCSSALKRGVGSGAGAGT